MESLNTYIYMTYREQRKRFQSADGQNDWKLLFSVHVKKSQLASYRHQPVVQDPTGHFAVQVRSLDGGIDASGSSLESAACSA